MQNLNRLKHALSKLNIFSTFFFTLILISGCAAPKQQVKMRYFFPPLPDQPKIEWLGRYASQHDFPKTSNQKLKESIMGEEEAKKFDLPYGIASDGEGLVYVTDSRAVTVMVYDLNRNIVRELGDTAGSGAGSPYGGLFKRPLDIDCDQAGNIYVADMKNSMVYAFTKDEKPLLSMGEGGILNRPTGIGVNSRLNRIYVADDGLNAVAVFDSTTGQHLFTFGKRGVGEGEFILPSDVAVASNDNIIVADSANARMQIFDKDGKFLRMFGKRGDGFTDFQMPKGVAINRDDHLFITEARQNRVMVFDMEGNSLQNLGSKDDTGARIGGFSLPRGIFVDKKERLYVVDSLNKKFDVFQIVNEEWLKERPIKEGEAAKPITKEGDKK